MTENFESICKNTIPKHEMYDDFELPLPEQNSVRDSVSKAPFYPADHSSQQFWQEDGVSLTGNPYASVFGNTHLPGGMGDDHISFTGYPYSAYTVSTDTTPDLIGKSPAIPWKYNEEKVVKELLEYIRGTYNQHYSAGDDKIQTLDLIEACGDGQAFCRSNILKYASRYDKKGTARRDIMKILHYAVLLMNFNDKNAKRELYSQ